MLLHHCDLSTGFGVSYCSLRTNKNYIKRVLVQDMYDVIFVVFEFTESMSVFAQF